MSDTCAPTPILNGPEQVLYGRLVRAFPGKIVLPHAAIARRWVSGFVLCRSDFTAIAVIELAAMPRLEPGSTVGGERRSGERRSRDRRADSALRAAGIKVIQVPATDIPSEAALKALVATLPVHASTEELLRRAV